MIEQGIKYHFIIIVYVKFKLSLEIHTNKKTTKESHLMNLSLKSFHYADTFTDHVEQQYHAQVMARHDTSKHVYVRVSNI